MDHTLESRPPSTPPRLPHPSFTVLAYYHIQNEPSPCLPNPPAPPPRCAPRNMQSRLDDTFLWYTSEANIQDNIDDSTVTFLAEIRSASTHSERMTAESLLASPSVFLSVWVTRSAPPGGAAARHCSQ